MFSIYSSFFNVQSSGFKWKETINNWLHFLRDSGEIVIAVNTSTDDSAKLVREYLKTKFIEYIHVKTAVVECDIPYTDPAFDGKIKAFALSHCTQPYAILLDCDELLVPDMKRHWTRQARELDYDKRVDGFLIPTIDIFRDENHYRCDNQIGAKWYLHRNIPNITRGVVNFARREDGSIDITKSDTCEAIYKDSGDLIRAYTILTSMPHFMQIKLLENGETPFVIHTGWLDKEQRLKQSEFWTPVWNLRNGAEVEKNKTMEELDKIKAYRHHLPKWKMI